MTTKKTKNCPVLDIFSKIVSSNKDQDDTFLGSEAYNLADEHSLRQKESNDKLRQSLIRFRSKRKNISSDLNHVALDYYLDASSTLSSHSNKTSDYIQSSSTEQNYTVLRKSTFQLQTPLLNDFIPFSTKFISPTTSHFNINKAYKNNDVEKISSLPKTSIKPAHLQNGPNSNCENFFDQLHEEIIALLHFMNLTDKETQSRLKLLAKMKVICEYLWPQCNVRWFGSFYTGLSLPNGDIDICILNAKGSKKEKIQTLAKFIKEFSLAMPSSIEMILNARVPIVKFIDSEYSIQLDICFDEQSALETSDYIRSKLNEYPQLKPLIITNKIFLLQRHLGETYSGGIGSYLLFTMCLGFLQYIERLKMPQFPYDINLGHLLFQFYQFYGNDYDNEYHGIRVAKRGSLFPKFNKTWENGGSTILTIESPLNPKINLGQSVYKYRQIQKIWKNAWMNLVSTSREFEEAPSQDSLLDGLINFDHELFSRNTIVSINHLQNFGVASLLEIPQLTDDSISEANLFLERLVGHLNSKRNEKSKKSIETDNLKFRRYL